MTKDALTQALARLGDLSQLEGHTPGPWNELICNGKINGQHFSIMWSTGYSVQSWAMEDRPVSGGFPALGASSGPNDLLAAASPDLLLVAHDWVRMQAENERLHRLVEHAYIEGTSEYAPGTIDDAKELWSTSKTRAALEKEN